MKRFSLYLIPAVLIAGQARYARLGDFDGKVDVQLQAADPWVAAERNLPLTESTWLRTAAASKLEIELDEGSAWRMGPDSQAEISDYSRLSTGQRVTLLSLDRGLAWFTGEPAGKDALTMAVPGAQITFIRGARIRLEALDTWSRISVIEGTVRFSSPAAEMDLHEGQSIRVEPANASRFFLERSIVAIPLDRWSEDRDIALAAPASAARVAQRYGVKDLDAAGQWLQTADLGMVWKPAAAEGWAPFQKGRWLWYASLGYTWVSNDSWGWLPYHYGRWWRSNADGWVWVPGVKTVFKPGDVYWLRGATFAGWGALAPNEDWLAGAAPQLFTDTATTFAAFQQDARVIDPAGLVARPQNPLSAGGFTTALPSPAFPAARLEALRPRLRVGSTRVTPSIPGVNFEDTLAPPSPEPPPPVTDPGAYDPSASVPPPDPQQGPPNIGYPGGGYPGGGYPGGGYPGGYSGIIVVTPPGNPDYARRYPIPNRQSGTALPPGPASGPVTPPAGGPPVQPPSGRPRVKPAEIPTVEPRPPVTREARNEAKPPSNPAQTANPATTQPPAPVKPPEIRPRVVPVDVPKVEPSHAGHTEAKAEAKSDKSSSESKPAPAPAAAKTDSPSTAVGAKK
ncbi:MAG TPA: DUF6600 domain-containing protein [Candidatus Acidoferrales bacterium]|nr:DUF6600 domain-containing protein [Candidatus Acidoferrales bacterium]